MRYLSVCAGIEAASVAWHCLGWEPLALSEIEAFPRAVLAHRYPGVPLHGDFTVLRDQPWIENADILVGGTPCQAFSVAGLRNSLADDRGNLSLEFVRLADAIDDLRLDAGREPCIVVWENVPGVLSVRDNAFGCFLAALAGEDAPIVPHGGKWTDAGLVIGPRRAVAWRILDAQYFGLAQRRRRVFVVSSDRDGFDPAAVLLEFEGLRRDTPPRREAGQGSSAGIEIGPSGGRFTDLNPTLDARAKDGPIRNQLAGAVLASTGDISHCLNAGGMGRQDYETETLVTHSLRAEGFDASEDGTGRGTPLVPVAYRTTGNNGVYETGDLVHALTTATDPNSHVMTVPLQEVGKRTGISTNDPRAGIGIGEDGDPMYTLQAGAQHGVAAYAFQPRIARNGRGDMGDVVNALNAQSGETGKGDAAPCVAVADTLSVGANQTTGFHTEVTAVNMAVRRLLPEECEALQGFPRGYTNIPWRGKPAANCPDGPRYKALGNSMAVPVMRWIGRRIAEALA